jgi:hypothetical protein
MPSLKSLGAVEAVQERPLRSPVLDQVVVAAVVAHMPMLS